MLESLLLIAQEQKPAAGGGGDLISLLPMILIAILFFVIMIILPARQEKKRRESLLAALKPKDKVVTHSGIIGVVSNISDKDDEVTLRLEEGKVKVLKSAIARILTSSEPQKDAGKTGTES